MIKRTLLLFVLVIGVANALGGCASSESSTDVGDIQKKMEQDSAAKTQGN